LKVTKKKNYGNQRNSNLHYFSSKTWFTNGELIPEGALTSYIVCDAGRA